jgi:signal transduction histidine kinase
VETNLYRILQEALQNVHKHAGATQVSVTLTRRDGTATLVIEDNGRGYDPDAEKAAGTSKGMGVTNMRERARLLGGEVKFQTAPGAGTTIYVRVPTKSPWADRAD